MKASDKNSSSLSRRRFIKIGAQGTAGVGLAHAVGAPLLLLPGCSSDGEKTVHGACYHDCPDTCSWTVSSFDNRIIGFEASRSNPYTAGSLCGKMTKFPQDVTFHPDRILTPLKRTGKKGQGVFTPISWQQALGEVAEKLKSIVQKNGGESVLPYSFAGTEGLIQKNLISQRFFNRLGASRLERTICGDAAVSGVLATNGQTTGVLPQDILYSKYVILWGTNPLVSNQHLWRLVVKAREKGAKIVVIDPFLSQTAQQADWHIQPMPGTDTMLAFGLIHIILKEGLQDQEYIDQHTLGIEALEKHVNEFTPGHVAEITGIGQETLFKLAREYATASPSVIRVLIGMEHQANGASAFRAVAMLPALTGAWTKQGGGLMHMTYELFGEALNWESAATTDAMEIENTRSVNMVQIGRALTDQEMNPPISALFVYNSNPAVIAPNQNLVIKGLEREDLLTVVLEHFITDTARYADYIFPATTQLEHWDLLTSWGQTYINLNQPALEPRGESRPNTEFFRLLAREMNYTDSPLYETDVDLIKQFLNSEHKYLQGITFESLKKSGWAQLNLPEPWIPHALGNFGTNSGKCEFYNATLNPPLPEYHAVVYSRDELEAFPLQLLTVKSVKNFLNSSHANVTHLLKKEGQPMLDLHPADAESRNISDGDEVKVFNQNGTVFLTARIRNKVRKGVASMPQGYWSSLMVGGSSANALTNDRLTDMGRGAALHETRVEVQRI